jgi:ferrous-iron efflux pump FieF
MEATQSAVIRSAILLAIKIGAFLLTGSAVLMAALVDSMVDVVASLIAHVVKPREHYQQHQLALIQASWIIMGGLIVITQSIREFHQPVDMALAGIIILVVTLVIDSSIVRKLNGSGNPVVIGLKEDIKADMSNSAGGLVALALIAVGFPMVVDKLAAITISVFLIIKGLKLFCENMEAASVDHAASHKLGEGGVERSHDGVR